MRRALLAVLAGGLLLTASACGSDASSDDEAAPAPTTVVPSSAAPTTSAPDYTANTKQVCTRLQTLYTAELTDFGAAMGKMITYKEAKDSAEAKKAADAAAGKLKAAATKIRKETAAAENPELKAAGMTSAAKLDASAQDRKYINKVTSLKNYNSSIEGQLNTWLAPVSGYCG